MTKEILEEKIRNRISKLETGITCLSKRRFDVIREIIKELEDLLK